MATTATKRGQIPLGGDLSKMQVWRIAAGASDTTATWNTGLNNVWAAVACSQDDSSLGIVPNSNDGTEGSSKGSVYFTGVINSAKLDVIVIGS